MHTSFQAAQQSGPAAHTAMGLGSLVAFFLKIGTIGFGGGMAVIALMEREIAQRRKLMPAGEFVHGVALGQILGSFAVNASFFIGYRLHGLTGGLLCSVAFLLPSVTMVIALSAMYFQYHAIPALQGAVAGLGPVVIAIIVAAAWSLARKVLLTRTMLLVAAAAALAGAFGVNAVWVLAAAGVFALLLPIRSAARGNPGRFAVLAFPALTIAPLSTLGTLSIMFVKIGCVFFGGGFVLIPVLHHHLVTDLGWLTTRQFIDGVAISNLTPGPVAVLATFAGYHVAGIWGALAATAALFLPGFALMFVISRGYERFRNDARASRFLSGINPAVVGLLLGAAILLARSDLASWRGWAAAALSLLLVARYRWHPAPVLAMGAAAGYLGLLP